MTAIRIEARPARFGRATRGRWPALVALGVVAVLGATGARADAEAEAPLATLAAPVKGDAASCGFDECAMGNLIAEAMLAHAASEADGSGPPRIAVAIVPADAIAGPLAAGPVARADLRAVLPEAARLVRFDLTGAELLAALEQGASGPGPLLQVAGLRYAFDPDLPAGQRVSEVRLWRPAGTVMVRHGNEWNLMHQSARWLRLDPAARYLVVATDALRREMAGFGMPASEPAQDGPPLLDVVAAYLRMRATDAPLLDGRITRR